MTPIIAILGAGPGGLMLARLLELAKIDYTVFERDDSSSARTQGGTLDVHVNSGQIALREAGLFDQFKSRARWNVATIMADKQGSIFARMESEGEETDRPEIDRRDLRSILLDSIPKSKVQWGSRIQSVTKETDGLVSVHHEEGVESGFRLVVGADGAWSKARRLVTPARPQYSGYTYISTAVTASSPIHSYARSLIGEGNYMSMESGKQIIAQCLGDGSYQVSVGLSVPEHWSEETGHLSNPTAFRKWLLQEPFADWAEANTDLVKHSEGDFRPWPLYSLPAECFSWETVSGVTLIGDAAQLTTPDGEGVNSAMYDSLQLAQQIAQHGPDGLDRAVAEYEKQMFPRAVERNKSSKGLNKLMWGEDSPEGFKQLMGLGDAEQARALAHGGREEALLSSL